MWRYLTCFFKILVIYMNNNLHLTELKSMYEDLENVFSLYISVLYFSCVLKIAGLYPEISRDINLRPKSNHTVGVVRQLPFDTWETTSWNPNTNGVFSLTRSTSEEGRKSRKHDQIWAILPIKTAPNIRRQTLSPEALQKDQLCKLLFINHYEIVYLLTNLEYILNLLRLDCNC